MGVTCAVQAGVLRCFSAPDVLADARPGGDDFRVCMPSTDGSCEPIRVRGSRDAANATIAADTEGLPAAEPGGSAEGCVVHDESGTPLNVRAEPSGRAAVVGTLANDTLVRVLESRGPWRRIDGPPGGWVWNEAVVCE